MTDDELIALRELSIAVLADRLYILGSDQWANPELVARWNAEITPTTILQLTRELAAARALLREVQAYVLRDDEKARRLTDRIDAALSGKDREGCDMSNYDELIGTLRHKGAYKKVWLGEETFELRCQDPTAIDAADAIVQLQARVAELEAEQGATLGESGMVIRLLQQERDNALDDLAAARKKLAGLEQYRQRDQLAQRVLKAEADLAAARALLREARAYVVSDHGWSYVYPTGWLADRIDDALKDAQK